MNDLLELGLLPVLVFMATVFATQMVFPTQRVQDTLLCIGWSYSFANVVVCLTIALRLLLRRGLLWLQDGNWLLTPGMVSDQKQFILFSLTLLLSRTALAKAVTMRHRKLHDITPSSSISETTIVATKTTVVRAGGSARQRRYATTSSPSNEDRAEEGFLFDAEEIVGLTLAALYFFRLLMNQTVATSSSPSSLSFIDNIAFLLALFHSSRASLFLFHTLIVIYRVVYLIHVPGNEPQQESPSGGESRNCCVAIRSLIAYIPMIRSLIACIPMIRSLIACIPIKKTVLFFFACSRPLWQNGGAAIEWLPPLFLLFYSMWIEPIMERFDPPVPEARRMHMAKLHAQLPDQLSYLLIENNSYKSPLVQRLRLVAPPPSFPAESVDETSSTLKKKTTAPSRTLGTGGERIDSFSREENDENAKKKIEEDYFFHAQTITLSSSEEEEEEDDDENHTRTITSSNGESGSDSFSAAAATANTTNTLRPAANTAAATATTNTRLPSTSKRIVSVASQSLSRISRNRRHNDLNRRSAVVMKE